MKWKPGMTEGERNEYNRRRRARYAAMRYKAGKGYSPQVYTDPVTGARVETASAGKPIPPNTLRILEAILLDEKEE